ncbi:hypothetical protein ANCDUO_02642 [Ancylostoma duodenale]|uniref:Uncharacterized protein n=1 Tax=Ancylostoma duodenale TaxID=51022 RepID=A0A0C2HBZ4_9BILA|nr:hypothetical protein ANCDUO_02642 [Ancylostoma duodenale]
MDKEELNRVGARDLLESIRGFGIWPMLDGDDKWRVEDFDLTSLLIQVSKFRNVHVFVKYSVSLDSRNVSRYLIEGGWRVQRKLILGELTWRYFGYPGPRVSAGPKGMVAALPPPLRAARQVH